MYFFRLALLSIIVYICSCCDYVSLSVSSTAKYSGFNFGYPLNTCGGYKSNGQGYSVEFVCDGSTPYMYLYQATSVNQYDCTGVPTKIQCM